jgi:adenosine deaminase
LSRRWHTVLFLLIATIAAAQRPNVELPVSRPAARAPVADLGEQRTARYLDSIRNQPSLLIEFVRQLPKGADLHNHLTGAVYAESYINFAAHNNLCVERTTLRLVVADNHPEPQAAEPKPLCDDAKGHVPASRAFSDYILYRDLIDAWSMRHFAGNATGESAHDHFFDTFSKFSLAKNEHLGEMLAEAVSRAGRERVSYLELMLSPDNGGAAHLGAGMGWTGDMAAQRQKVIEKEIARVVAAARINLDQGEAKMRSQLGCGSMNADPGCAATVRYQYEIHRTLGRDQVFAEMVAGFEMATADPRVVGLNMVAPEDAYVPMRDFSLHMQMLDYLHQLYPKVHIALHAGELAPALVPPEDLRFHIRESIERGHAERIGHGVSVMYEHDPLGLLREMAAKNVLVEICATSNQMILGVQGPAHPLPIYLKYGVPVAIATDDEGVARSDINQEYLRAIETYALSYPLLKRMARNSLEHAFLPGASLWSDAASFRRAACRADRPGASQDSLTGSCRQFLQGSERARLQWNLEGQFAAFERVFRQSSAVKP